jgi:hypothetical protein
LEERSYQELCYRAIPKVRWRPLQPFLKAHLNRPVGRATAATGSSLIVNAVGAGCINITIIQ